MDILITGDKDFTDIEIEKPEILTPSDFMATLWQNIRFIDNGKRFL